MTQMDKIKAISTLLRYAVIGIATVICLLLVSGYSGGGFVEIAMKQPLLTQLWHDMPEQKLGLALLIAPMPVLFLLFCYWLQYLFACYQQANFFGENSMRAYTWLVWSKISMFVYSTFWVLLLPLIPGIDSSNVISIDINLGDFFTLLLLVIIIYILRAAKTAEEENKAFI